MSQFLLLLLLKRALITPRTAPRRAIAPRFRLFPTGRFEMAAWVKRHIPGSNDRHFAKGFFFSEVALASLSGFRNATFDRSFTNRVEPTFLIIASGAFFSGV
jgi:hypothetical protein